MYSVQDIKRLLAQYNIHPRRSAGQNFLIDRRILQRIVQAGKLRRSDRVLEVGSGFGSLTVLLAEHVQRVLAVEKDPSCVSALRKLSTFYPQIHVSEDDIRYIPLADFVGREPYKVVANIPYNITSFFLRTLLTAPNPPIVAVLLLQKEVGERLLARSGNMSLLGLSVQIYSQPEFLFPVSRRAFWPQPRVESCVIRFTLRSQKERDDMLCGIHPETIIRYGKIGFSSRRKTLINNLCAGTRVPRKSLQRIFSDISLSLLIRPQELGVIEWVTLVGRLEKL